MSLSVDHRDYEAEGGLMQHIETVTAPPSFASNEPRTSRLYKSLKSSAAGPLSRWKGGNCQYCSSCQEGGELLCCDQCPASFHLICLQPPMSADQVPPGAWLCARCECVPQMNQMLVNAQQQIVHATAASTTTQSNETRAPAATSNGIGRPRKYGKAATSSSSNSKNGKATNGNCQKSAENGMEKLCAVLDEQERDAYALITMIDNLETAPTTSNGDSTVVCSVVSSLNILSKAAAALNPSEFSIHENMIGQEYLPGVHDRAVADKSERQHLQPDTNGMIDRTVRKRCHQCRRSCLHGVLLSCDFCPCLFHMDCVDPPLTAAPKTRWMCPNHVEPFIDSRMLHSMSHSRRMKLWATHARQPITAHLVQEEFFRKTRSADQKAPFRRKKPQAATIKCVNVPCSVKEQYARAESLHKSPTPADLVTFVSAIDELRRPVERVVPSSRKRQHSESAVSEHTAPTSAHGRNALVVHEPKASCLPPHWHPPFFRRSEPVLACVMLKGSHVALPLHLAVTTIGRRGCHLDLTKCGPGNLCSQLAVHHCTISLDRMTGEFELMSYSPFGVLVDGVCCAMQSATSTTQHATDTSWESEVRALLKADMDMDMDGYRDAKHACNALSVQPTTSTSKCCACDVTMARLGDQRHVVQSVRLRHGSTIRIGCMQLLFATML